jgi:hypothetical protein
MYATAMMLKRMKKRSTLPSGPREQANEATPIAIDNKYIRMSGTLSEESCTDEMISRFACSGILSIATNACARDAPALQCGGVGRTLCRACKGGLRMPAPWNFWYHVSSNTNQPGSTATRAAFAHDIIANTSRATIEIRPRRERTRRSSSDHANCSKRRPWC